MQADGTPYSLDEVWGAVDSVMPIIELCGRRSTAECIGIYTYIYIYIYVYVYVYVYLIYLSIYISIHPSIHLSIIDSWVHRYTFQFKQT